MNNFSLQLQFFLLTQGGFAPHPQSLNRILPLYTIKAWSALASFQELHTCSQSCLKFKACWVIFKKSTCLHFRDSFHENVAFQSLVFRIDRCDAFNTAGYLLTNLSRLMEPSPHWCVSLCLHACNMQMVVWRSMAIFLLTYPYWKEMDTPR